MPARFLTSVDPPPPGFTLQALTRRDLLVDPVVVYVPALDVLEQVAPAYAARMYGVVALPGDTYEQIQLGPLLWLVMVPPSLLHGLRDFTALTLAAIAEAVQYREQQVEGGRLAERLGREFAATRVDYNRVTGRLQAQLSELMLAQRALSASEAELRQMNDELERRVHQRTAELEAVNKELESFSYSVSHDLRAPLRAISGFSAILNEDFGAALPAEAAGYLNRILSAVERMDQLINDLLALARASNKALDPVRVDLSALAAEALVGLQHLAAGRELDIRIAPAMCVHADERLLKLVLENLLNNAIKFTKGRQPGVITVGQVLDAPQPTFYVRDNGAGFDMAAVGRLFTPFQRLHSEREFDGTGIGLATTRRVIARHGGNVWAEGSVGEGATFFFSLPT